MEAVEGGKVPVALPAEGEPWLLARSGTGLGMFPPPRGTCFFEY